MALVYGTRMLVYSDMIKNMCVMMITASTTAKHLFVLFDLFLMFGIPLMLVFSLNMVIIGHLRDEIVTSFSKQEVTEGNKKKMKMLVILIMMFFVTRLPLFASQSLNTFNSNVQITAGCMIFLKLMAFTSAWTHVIVFFYFNEKAFACLEGMVGRKLSTVGVET